MNFKKSFKNTMKSVFGGSKKAKAVAAEKFYASAGNAKDGVSDFASSAYFFTKDLNTTDLSSAVAGDYSGLVTKVTSTIASDPKGAFNAVKDAGKGVYNFLKAGVNLGLAAVNAAAMGMDYAEFEEDSQELSEDLEESKNININKKIFEEHKNVLTQEKAEEAEMLKAFVNVAYKKLEEKEEFTKNALAEHPDWEVLAVSEEDGKTDLALFKATAFINKETKEIVIAHAGTKVSSLEQAIEDLGADAILASGVMPAEKFAAIKLFINKIKLVTDVDLSEYSFTTSGHSLGSAFSDIAAVELMTQGFKVNKSETFDNPGAYPLIEYAIKKDMFSSKITMQEAQEKIDFSTYQAFRPNLVSCANEQMGEMRVTVIDDFARKAQKLMQESQEDIAEMKQVVSEIEANKSNVSSLYKLYDIATRLYNKTDAKQLSEIKKGLASKVAKETDSYKDVYNDIKEFSELLPQVKDSCSKLSVVECSVKSYELFNNIVKLSNDAISAYDQANIMVSRLVNLPGHSLGKFETITPENTFVVKKGYGAHDAKLELDVDQAFIEMFNNPEFAHNTSEKGYFSLVTDYNKTSFSSVDLSIDGNVVKTVSIEDLQKALYPESHTDMIVAEFENIKLSADNAPEDLFASAIFIDTPNGTSTEFVMETMGEFDFSAVLSQSAPAA